MSVTRRVQPIAAPTTAPARRSAQAQASGHRRDGRVEQARDHPEGDLAEHQRRETRREMRRIDHFSVADERYEIEELLQWGGRGMGVEARVPFDQGQKGKKGER